MVTDPRQLLPETGKNSITGLLPTKDTFTEKLSILICKDSFFYLRQDRIDRIITYHKELQLPSKTSLLDKLQNLWDEEHITQHGGDLNIKMALLTNQFALVPVTMYEEPFKHLYYERLNFFPSYQALWVDSMATRDFSKVVFGIEKLIAKSCAAVVEPGQYIHIISGLIKKFYQDYGHLEGKFMLSYVRGGYECILLFNDGKLLFSNVFEVFSDDDILYYLAMIINQLEIDPFTVDLYLAGDWYASTPRHQWLGKKFKSVRFAQTKSHLFNRSAEKKQLKTYELFDLVSIWA